MNMDELMWEDKLQCSDALEKKREKKKHKCFQIRPSAQRYILAVGYCSTFPVPVRYTALWAPIPNPVAHS